MIRPQSPLPEIGETLWIDATGQPGARQVQVDGAGAYGGVDVLVDGLKIVEAEATIRGLVVSSFSNRGILSRGKHKIVLEEVSVARNQGSGIEIEGPLAIKGEGNYITGNYRSGIFGSGRLPIDIEAAEITDNGGWGISNDGPISIERRGVISRNGKRYDGGGVRTDTFMSSAVSLNNVEISDNIGPGVKNLISNAWVVLENVTVSNNTGYGIQDDGDLILKGNANYVSGNGKTGILASGNKVDIRDRSR